MQSTKSYGTQRQEINKVIWYVPGDHDALAAGTSSDLPAAAQILSLYRRSGPTHGLATIHTEASLLFELASVLSGSVRCAPGSVEKLLL